MRKTKAIGVGMILILSMILFSALASAIGITPGKTTVDFKPELEKEVTFTILNNEHTILNNEEAGMKILLTVDGEMAEYITLENTLVEFKAGEEAKDAAFKLKLPKKIKDPGDHLARIIATEVPLEWNGEGTSVGMRLAVATLVNVRVAYPGKHAEARMDIDETAEDGTINFIIPLKNLGEEDISRAKASVEIRKADGTIAGNAESEETTLRQKETKELVASWKPDVEAGEYKAVAVITYDDKAITLEKNFQVGSATVKLVDVTVRNFKLGDVAKFNLLVKNTWNTDIGDLYAELIITNLDGDVITSEKSIVVSAEQGEEVVLNTFWDTAGIESGVYNARVILHYAGKTSETLMKAELTLDSIKTSFVGTTARAVSDTGAIGTKSGSILTLAIVGLVVINLGWIFYLRRRKAK